MASEKDILEISMKLIMEGFLSQAKDILEPLVSVEARYCKNRIDFFRAEELATKFVETRNYDKETFDFVLDTISSWDQCCKELADKWYRICPEFMRFFTECQLNMRPFKYLFDVRSHFHRIRRKEILEERKRSIEQKAAENLSNAINQLNLT